MNSAPKSSSDPEGGASNTPNVVTNPLARESAGSSSPGSLMKVVEEQRLDFIDDAARLDPKECVKRLGSFEGNIFHFAALKNKVEFMDKAMKKLSRPVIQSLLSQRSEEYCGHNPLHIAARTENHKVVKIILDFYRSSASSSEAQSTTEATGDKPWLGLDYESSTPLHLALQMCNERIALDILSMDVESLSGMEDWECRGPLFMAMESWLYRVALQILTSAPNCTLRGDSGQTVLFLAANAPDHIFYRLVEKAPHFIIGQDRDGDTLLHHWVMSATLHPVEFVVDNDKIAPGLRRDFIDQLSRTNICGRNPLHEIIRSFEDDALSVKMAEVLVNAYKRERAQLFSSPEFQPPWLMKDMFGNTPLHTAIKFKNEQLASYLLSLDPIKFLENDDNLLFYSIKHKCPKVAEDTLGIVLQNASLTKLLIHDADGQNALHFVPECTEVFLSQLLEMHPEFMKERDDDRVTILHSWIKIGKLWPFEYMIKREDIKPKWRRSFIELLYRRDREEKNPLHLAASSSSKDMVDIVKLLLDASYNKFFFYHLLGQEDSNHNTPLGIAVSERNEQLALLFLSMHEILRYVEDNLALKAIEHECHEVVKFLLDWTAESGNEKFLKSDECNVLHCAWKFTGIHNAEETGKLIVERWPELINGRDKDGRTPLETASIVGASWLVKLILQKDRSWIRETPLAWVQACEGGHLSTILAFADKSLDFKDHCRFHGDTPLHRIQGVHYNDYKALLDHALIKEMKNIQNKEGETPLHVAIKRKNIELAEILLKMDDVDWTIKDKKKKTAMDLLEATCKQDENWKRMCDTIEVDPTSRTTYKAGLAHMRDIFSLVAILLATITFTAGFTLPGGVDNSGQAVFAAKAAFVVFILSDGYAMCCSMLVLFCIMWSMVFRHRTSSSLIDRSLMLLKQSLYGTLIAFMTGVYSVVHRKSLWVAIVIFSMCSAVIIASDGSILTGECLQWLCLWMKRRHRATPASDQIEAHEREALNIPPELELASMV